MSVAESAATTTPLLEVRYTVEELAVIADLLNLESLPGVFPVPDMPLDLRSLATRCLVARGIVVMPNDGGVEVTQPHATLFAGMLEARTVLQVSRSEGNSSASWSWFDLGDNCVRVGEDEGVVDVAAFNVPALAAIESTLGMRITGTVSPPVNAEVVVELTKVMFDTELTSSERSVAALVDGEWKTLEG